MSLELTYYGHPSLRSKGRHIEMITPEISSLAEEMIETMYENDGCGLAAQQIGRSLQMAVIDTMPGMESRPSKAWRNGKPVDVENFMPLVLINPEITPVGNKTNIDTEACLSIPNLYEDIERPARVKIRYQSLDNEMIELEAEGLLARAAMHETDHLHGILFIDHLSPKQLAKHQPLLNKLQQENSMF